MGFWRAAEAAGARVGGPVGLVVCRGRLGADVVVDSERGLGGKDDTAGSCWDDHSEPLAAVPGYIELEVARWGL